VAKQGEYGAALFVGDRFFSLPAFPLETVMDPTGAGDSFAAGMAFGYLQDRDIVRAAHYGNAMGAQRVSGSGLDVYRPLPETDKQIALAYGESS
jgi:adenosine kinase